MRFLMKIAIPTTTENAAVSNPKFNEELRALFLKLGAQATYSNTLDGRRFDYVLVDLDDVTQITAVAEPVFRFLKVKPEFLPEVTPQPYYGRVGY
jgi:hypothetical protein